MQEEVLRPIGHQYSDAPLPHEQVRCYSLTELFGEKLRALAERCRPRDLYDVVHMYRHPDLVGLAPAVASVLARKCAHAGIDVPTADSIRSSPYRAEIEREWENMLGHQLPKPLPPFAEFWGTLDEVFSWLGGELAVVVPPRIEREDLDPAWVAPRAIASWHRGFPFELIRYAGANRMKVEIDYRAEDGRWGPRRVEPYSLRRTKDGNLLLFVVNDRGQLRGYRVDRIAGVRPTDEAFGPVSSLSSKPRGPSSRSRERSARLQTVCRSTSRRLRYQEPSASPRHLPGVLRLGPARKPRWVVEHDLQTRGSRCGRKTGSDQRFRCAGWI